MKVKYIGESDPLELMNGKTYEVTGIQKMDGKPYYMVIDETGEEYPYEPGLFEVEKPGQMTDCLKELERFQIEFICRECEISEEELFRLDDEQLYDHVYDVMCDIEMEESPDDEEPENERCRIASGIVTLLGESLVVDEEEERMAEERKAPRWEDEEMVWEQPDIHKIRCATCFLREPDRKGLGVKGATLGCCAAYPIKPNGVLWHNEDCPYYIDENEEDED